MSQKIAKELDVDFKADTDPMVLEIMRAMSPFRPNITDVMKALMSIMAGTYGQFDKRDRENIKEWIIANLDDVEDDANVAVDLSDRVKAN